MTKTTKIYGIKNCNTMKKTFALFDELGMSYEFVDYKKVKPSEQLLSDFISRLGLDEVINRKGTTYRKLSDEEKSQSGQANTAIALLVENSSMIKRPILVFPDGEVQAGFDEAAIKAKM